ncbi:hypothetical protein LQ318_04940 [Aliifodinibius salicampi]|uniref:Uncharacterized protein n=1 Tax=Fodinibius salicampi TaxID=1920655 RepID=A0ABT3PWN1_9BACT|nr:hypothetical protein [Fodinibius salicampi]MCW9712248.1 hypothetical protein [Fodinibius salicampi]
MVARHHGRSYTMETLRNRSGINREGYRCWPSARQQGAGLPAVRYFSSSRECSPLSSTPVNVKTLGMGAAAAVGRER